MLTFGGISLPLPDPDWLARVEAALPLCDLRDFARRSFPGRLPTLGLPWLARDWTPQLQSVLWPNTASRWAEGWFIVDDKQLSAIRTQAYLGGTLNALPLVINDGRRPPVTLSLFPLSAIPLAKVLPNFPAVAPGTYLLPLVDVRFRWWQIAAQITVTPGTTTWLQLFAALASALGITLAVDAIPAAYLTPPADFNTVYEFLPPQLDAACRCVGLKLIANLDGTFRAASAATAQMLLSVNGNLPNPTVAGALIDLTNDATSDLAGVLPTSVSVLFPTVDASNNPTGATTVQTVMLASLLPPASVNLPQFVGAATFTGTELLRCSANAGPANGTQIAALATQLAADWYAWQGVKRAHLCLSGAAAWTPTGGEERIEWFHGADNILTRVRRPPWNERDEAGALVLGSAGSAGPTITNSTINYANDTITVSSSSITLSSVTATITSNSYLTLNAALTINGSFPLTINAPFEICGWQFWCCTSYTLPSSVNDNLDLPTNAGHKTVIDLVTPGTGSTISGIVPAQPGVAVNTGDITAATNASPIVLTVPGWTTQPTTGQVVVVVGVNGNTAANGTWVVQAATATTLTLQGSTGSGAFTASAGSTVKVVGPQFLVLRNADPSSTITLLHLNNASNPTNRIALPFNAWGITLPLKPGEIVGLWWDGCASSQWSVIFYTPEWFACRVQSGTFNFEPHLNLISTDTYRLNITQADDAANLETQVTLTPGTPTITVSDTHGHTVTGVSTLIFLDGTNDTATVGGGAGNASVTVNAAGGGSGVTSAEDRLNGSVNLNSDGTYTVIRAVTVSSAGVYLVWGMGTYSLPGNAGGFQILAELYSITNAAAINFTADTVMLEGTVHSGDDFANFNTETLQARFAASGADTIQLRAKCGFSGSTISVATPSLIVVKTGESS